MEPKFDINFFGFITAFSGLGEASRNNVKALQSQGFKVNVFDLANLELNTIFDARSINIFQIYPQEVHDFFIRYRIETFKKSFNIAFWVWETDDFPDEYQNCFDYFDEIWTPSSYCQAVISKKSPVPVLNMPHAVPILTISNAVEGIRVRLLKDRGDTFLFTSIFDISSLIFRKNVVGLIRAFKLAFGHNSKDATLLLKTLPNERFKEDRALILKEIGDDRSVIFYEEKLKQDEVHLLLNQIDCYISLHHSEGFGLTMAEAMGYGKLVIATGYSGNMEFMNHTNSLLVNFELNEITESIGPFQKGMKWADPDIHHAAYLMTKAFKGGDEIDRLKSKAREQISNYHSYAYIGRAMADRIHVIGQHIKNRVTDETNMRLTELRNENQLLKLKLEKLKNIGFIKLKIRFKKLKSRILGKKYKKYLWE